MQPFSVVASGKNNELSFYKNKGLSITYHIGLVIHNTHCNFCHLIESSKKKFASKPHSLKNHKPNQTKASIKVRDKTNQPTCRDIGNH